jgi:hypothetical protein
MPSLLMHQGSHADSMTQRGVIDQHVEHGNCDLMLNEVCAF